MIHPPIDLEQARVGTPGDHYLAAGRVVPYKHTAMMVEACLSLGRSLRIAGTGPDLLRLRRIAAGSPLITFLGELSDAALWDEYSQARALLFAADEDFGMVPLEAQACGRPVIAFGHGGSLETVRGDGAEPTGLFFGEQTAGSLAQAIVRFESEADRFDPASIAAWAAGFRTEHFRSAMRSFLLEHAPGVSPYLAPV